MKPFGIALFLVGALILVYFGVIGVDAGDSGLRVTNFAALIIGCSLLISGSILGATGELIHQLGQLNDRSRASVHRKPQSDRTAQLDDKGANPDGKRKALKQGEQVLVETYRGTEIYQRYNGHYIGEKWFAGLSRAKDYIDQNSDTSSETEKVQEA